MRLQAAISIMVAGALAAHASDGQTWGRLAATAESQTSHKSDIPIEREKLFETLFAMLDVARRFGVKDPRYSESLRMITEAYLALNEIQKAEPYVKREIKALSLMRDDYPDLDFPLYCQGLIYERRHEFENARKSYQKAMAVTMKWSKFEESGPLKIFSHQAIVAFAQGRKAEAIEIIQKGLDFWWKLMKNRPARAVRLVEDCTINDLLRKQPTDSLLIGAYNETSKAMLTRSMERVTLICGEYSKPTCELRCLLTSWYIERGDIKSAQINAGRALSIARGIEPKDETLVIKCEASLEHALQLAQKNSDAKTLQRD